MHERVKWTLLLRSWSLKQGEKKYLLIGAGVSSKETVALRGWEVKHESSILPNELIEQFSNDCRKYYTIAIARVCDRFLI